MKEIIFSKLYKRWFIVWGFRCASMGVEPGSTLYGADPTRMVADCLGFEKLNLRGEEVQRIRQPNSLARRRSILNFKSLKDHQQNTQRSKTNSRILPPADSTMRRGIERQSRRQPRKLTRRCKVKPNTEQCLKEYFKKLFP